MEYTKKTIQKAKIVLNCNSIGSIDVINGMGLSAT